MGAVPEMTFHVRWPDGRAQACYSPSLVVAEHLAVGATYPVADFVARSRTALGIASARVQEKYGFPCALAARSLALIEGEAARAGAGEVLVERFEQ